LACELLVDVGMMRGSGSEPLFLFGAGLREAMALGFQLGTLIFPTVVPAMLWAWMDRETLRQFLPARAAQASSNT
ncbi:MAG: exosortase H-associated membrane protein, partial [Tepidisphaeraceae bacterium]